MTFRIGGENRKVTMKMKEIKLTLCNAELNDWMQKYAENAKWKSGWDNTEWG